MFPLDVWPYLQELAVNLKKYLLPMIGMGLTDLVQLHMQIKKSSVLSCMKLNSVETEC